MSTLTAALADGVTMTRRNVIKNRRNLDIVVFSTAAPIGFALMFAYVFGSAITVPGTNYREFLIAGILAQTMLSTATNTGVGIAADMKKGLIDRFRSLPMSPTAVLVGRTSSDVITNLLVIAMMSLTGLLIGWRIRSSFWEAAAGFALLLLFAYAASWITAAIGLSARSPEALSNAMFMFLMPMTFISNAFVPTAGLPTVLRVIAEWSPVSAVVGACRELFGNTAPGLAPTGPWPVENPVPATLCWIVLILVIFVPLSVHRYKKAVSK
ncbi:ABC transporter permease [Streptomyces durbertensis]|uniref:Transport permease protein n=1 Tax=Streptomyces durbertensis TaxID=2448886 RepID=A0ABR6ED87_9ACTN|nr:ABC transporter permease [Streptomyces durbertensis]MBB1243017.1 ABC transporter permease [Streptomyces durbertensis]